MPISYHPDVVFLSSVDRAKVYESGVDTLLVVTAQSRRAESLDCLLSVRTRATRFAGGALLSIQLSITAVILGRREE